MSEREFDMPTRRALMAVLDAARANLVKCSAGGYFGSDPCGNPAIYTFHSEHSTLCRIHGMSHEKDRSLWPHRQAELVAAIAAADAVLDVLPQPYIAEPGEEERA